MKNFIVTAESELNVRTGPGTNFSPVGVLNQGDEVVSPDFDDWIPVVVGARVLWASAKFLQATDAPAAPAPEATAPAAAPAPAAGDEPAWITWARKEIGEKEVPGAGDNPDIVAWFKLLKDFPEEYWHDATAWCAVFVNAGFCLNGVQGLGSAAAADWLKFGKKVAKPQKGDVVVFTWDDGTHHVAYFLAIEGDRVRVIGGNQSNAVTETTYPLRNVAGFRRAAA